MSAVLACGPGAVLSHRSAAGLWGFRSDARGRVDVTGPSRRGRYLSGIDAHCSRILDADGVTAVRSIPCTTVARTLLDLAEVVDPQPLERAIERAERLRLFDDRSLDHVLARANGRRGAPALESIMTKYEEPPLNQEELERRLLRLCANAGLGRPMTQVRIALPDGDAVFVDFLWAQSNLIVETDGHGTHGTRLAFGRDRRRDRRLMMLGYRVIRFTWLDVERSPDEVIRTIAALR
jgi:very-short-patch-repair endonuclease